MKMISCMYILRGNLHSVVFNSQVHGNVIGPVCRLSTVTLFIISVRVDLEYYKQGFFHIGFK